MNGGGRDARGPRNDGGHLGNGVAAALWSGVETPAYEERPSGTRTKESQIMLKVKRLSGAPGGRCGVFGHPARNNK